MSTGETSQNATARFSSPININNSSPTKKYPGGSGGTPKSPMLNSGTTVNRSLQAKQKLLGSKVSAPRPFNLPSLKQEQKVGTEVSASSPSGSHGWGSSSSSPSSSFTQPSEIHKKLGSQDQNANSTTHKSANEHTTASTVSATTHSAENKESATVSSATVNAKVDPESTSPTTETKTTPTIRGWAVPTVTPAAIQLPSQDFPTAAEAAGKKKPSVLDDKEYLKYASSDPNHTSWDEMVSEDMDDFSVDVVEFDDGTKVQVMDENDESSSKPVLPSDRFTDDYDRSYPSKPITTHTSDYHYTDYHYSSYKPSYRRSEDQGYNTRYNNSVHVGGGGYDSRRHSSANVDERRFSNDNGSSHRWSSRRDSTDNSNWSSNRRSSYDKKPVNPTPSYHPTLLQRPRRLSEQSFASSHSHHSRESDHHLTNPLQIISEPVQPPVDSEAAAEITAAQREVMLTAAERAKKRRDEEEAEYEAARVRARQKAEALAEKARLEKSEKEAKEAKKEPLIMIEKRPVANDSAAAATEKKSTKSGSKLAEKKESKRYSESSVATRTPQKPFEPSPLPDTSKPWNLIAAKKELVAKSSSVPPITTAALTSAALVKKDSDAVSTKDVEFDKKSSTTEAKTIESKEVNPTEKKIEESEIPTVDRNGKPLNEDEKNWEVFVSKIKHNPTAPIPAANVTSSNDWSSFAFRLEEEDDKKHGVAKSKDTTIVEEVNFNQNEDWGVIPQHITQGIRGWTRIEEDHYLRGRGGSVFANNRGGRGRGERTEHGGRGDRRSFSNVTTRQHYDSTSNDSWRQPSSVAEDQQPIVTEILKKEPATAFEKPKESLATAAQVQETLTPPQAEVSSSKKIRLTNMLKESSSPIFPDFIEKLAGKKPANMSFMVDVDESDKDITMMDHPISNSHTDSNKATSNKKIATIASDTEKVPEIVDEASAGSSSTTSTPPPRAVVNGHQSKSESSSLPRFTTNPNFPVLVYQYPISQPQQSHAEDNNQTYAVNGNQKPMNVYLMPQQQYLSGNQFMAAYPVQAAATAATPVYLPALSWQAQPEKQQRTPSQRSHISVNNRWESLANSNGYQNHRSAIASYGGSSFNRKPRGKWSSTSFGVRGRGGNSDSSGHHSKRYQQGGDSEATFHNQQESTPAVGTSL